MGDSLDAFLALASRLAKRQELTVLALFYSSRTMDIIEAIDAFGGLAQESRLKVFRLLVQAGMEGMAAGDIAKAVGVPKNTMSSHLAILSRAKLIQARKDGRSMIYALNLEGTRSLLSFLVEDCCQAEPSICGPMIKSTIATCGSDLQEKTDMTNATATAPMNVLFLCTGNSARSIMAECIMNRENLGKFKAYSAGSMPTGKVNPLAANLLKKLNYDVAGLRSKSWEEFAGPQSPVFDFVFTVCDDAARETCPVWPGQPMTAEWGSPDPAAVTGTDAERGFAFDDAYRMLQQRISIFVNLPLENLSKLSLQDHLDRIGRAGTVAAKESA